VPQSNETYIQSLFAERIGGALFGKEQKIYKFEKIKRAKRAALASHPGAALIDFGVGEPDEMAFPGVVQALHKEAERPENRGYADNGIPEFKVAAARYLQQVYGVGGINPETEVLHGIGSKPALAMLPAAFINPGDVTLMTAPGYEVMGTHTRWYGGAVVNLPLREENGFLPDLDSLPADAKKKAKLLYINYPNNPTGAGATKAFFEKVVKFAKENGVVVVHDAAYAALTFGARPLSFLSAAGAKDVGIEIHSLSKAFNMTGWRLAFVAGNERVIAAYGNVKDNYDSGQFKAIQKAGVYALDHPEITGEISAKYERRLRAMVAVLSDLGFNARMPAGSFYLYVKMPKGIKNGKRFASAEEFSEFLITEKLISTVPWDDAGAFIRFSATFESKGKADEQRVLEEFKKRMGGLRFEF
jgi:LL-diaminopimelate aminotransferase